MQKNYCNSMYSGDYQNTTKSKQEQQFSAKSTEFHNNTSSYPLNEDASVLQKNTHFFRSRNENPSNTFYDASENEYMQYFDNGNAMTLYTAKQESLCKDKRVMQTEPVGRINFTTRPNRISHGSSSAPSVLSSASKQHLTGRSDDSERSSRDFETERYLVEQQASNFNKVPENFQPPSKQRNQEKKSGQRGKNVKVKKRQDTRKRLKIPTKRVYITPNGKTSSNEKSSLDSAKEHKYIPDKRTSEETDHCSSYSESDIRYIAEQEDHMNERNMVYQKFQQTSKQSFPIYSVNDSLKCISNALRRSHYEAPNEKSRNLNYPKESDSRFAMESFLRKELSDFKEFLIHRRNLQSQRVNNAPKIRTIYIPESVRLQQTEELHNRMQKSDQKNLQEQMKENRRKMNSYWNTPYIHKTRRPKVTDDELWKQFEHNFRRYASTKRYSGEVIPCRISTEWMRKMGVVGELLTERDADAEFKKAAGPKITMNVHEYKEFLIALTMRMKLPFYEIYRRMCGI